MSRPRVVIINRGLRCDAAGCDYLDPEVVADESMIGKPCPKCGSTLLTEEDMAAIRLLQYGAHSVNAALGPINEDGKYVAITIPVLMDGSGKIEFADPVEEPQS